MTHILGFLPDLPSTTGGPNDLLTSFLSKVVDLKDWIFKIGGILIFIGAVKLGISFRSEDEKEAMQAALIMVAGLIIQDSVSAASTIFTVTGSAATEFNTLTKFAAGWVAKAGLVGVMIGGIQFAFAFKDNNAGAKVLAIKGMIAGIIVSAVSGSISIFI